MILLLAALACAPDDVTDAKDTGGDTSGDNGGDSGGNGDDTAGGNGGGTDSIVGTWLSEGDNISALFAGDPFNYVAITSTFNEDLSYTASATDNEGGSNALSGTYTVDTSTSPGTIVLEQASPYTATASGIWQIEGDTMTYEVVQTEPDYGFVPPTPESGFGTTSGPNIEPGVNVQVYVRQ